MAISDDNKRLYVDTTDPDNPIGISLWEIMKCLGYYKRDEKGGRNIGTIIKNAQINEFSLMKPYRSSTAEPSLEARQAAKFGWNTNNKTTSETMSAFLDKLKANGEGKNYWTYLRPRGLATYNERFRIRDFDGYDKDAKAYGDKSKVKKYDINSLSFKGDEFNITLTKNGNTSGTRRSNTFTATSKIVVQTSMDKISPAASSSYYWFVEGTFSIGVYSSSEILAYEEWDIGSDGNDVPSQEFLFRYDLDAIGEDCYIEYGWNIDNGSYISSSGEYFDISLKVTTDEAYTLAELPKGRQGIGYIGDTSWDYDTQMAVFGYSGTLIIVELSDGITTERKMMQWMGNPFIFEKAGFSTSLIESYTTMHLYVLRGDATSIFGGSISGRDYYGDISLADGYELAPYQIPYKDITYMVSFDYYADTFLEMIYSYDERDDEAVTGLTAAGANCTTDEPLINVVLYQDFMFKGVTSLITPTLYIDIYYNGSVVASGHDTRSVSTDGVVSFAPSAEPGGWGYPRECSIRVYIEVGGERQYLNLYTQELSYNITELYPLGI